MRIILASQSEARKKALNVLGLKYETISSDFDEKSIRHENPIKLATLLSEAKAVAIAKQHPDALIIASDLFVVFEGKIYEKPHSIDDAKQMLQSFAGNTLQIISGLAAYNPQTRDVITDNSVCNVTFRQLDNDEIDNYVTRYPVQKFSGAFDGDGMLLFAEKIEGDYNFAVGLDLANLAKIIRKVIHTPIHIT